jgi:hypothetical protein
VSSVSEAINFYKQHYNVLNVWSLRPGQKVILGSKDDRRCRFCGQQSPDVTFKLDAHAIPEALGNKSLYTNYECDSCNQMFGHGIENDFGNWSKPMRTLGRIKGKNGVPAIKKGTQGGWRIEYKRSGFKIAHHRDDSPPFCVDETAKTITFKIRRDPYTPVAVLKALVKMGLSVLPETEMENFREALDWIRCLDHTAGPVDQLPVIYTFIPGPVPNDLIMISTFSRKRDDIILPYAFFVLLCGNEAFQVFLPSPERDQSINDTDFDLPPFPHPHDTRESEFGPASRKNLDLMGRHIITNDVATVVMRYGTRTRIDQASGDGSVSSEGFTS